MTLHVGPSELIKFTVLICLTLIGHESICWQPTGPNPNVSPLRTSNLERNGTHVGDVSTFSKLGAAGFFNSEAKTASKQASQPALQKMVVISVSVDIKFASLMPLIIPAWRRIGIEPVFALFASCLRDAAEDASTMEDLMIKMLIDYNVRFHLHRDEPTLWKPGISRYISAGLLPEKDVIILADADLVPINRAYFDALMAPDISEKIYFDWDYNYDMLWKDKCQQKHTQQGEGADIAPERCKYPYRVRTCYLVGKAASFHKMYPYSDLTDAFADLVSDRFLNIYKPGFNRSVDRIYNNFDEYLSTALSSQMGMLALHPRGYRNHSQYPIMGEGRPFSDFSFKDNHTKDAFKSYLRHAADLHFKKEIFTFRDEKTFHFLKMVFEYLAIPFPTEYFRMVREAAEI